VTLRNELYLITESSNNFDANTQATRNLLFG
jgi:hypothetical protein